MLLVATLALLGACGIPTDGDPRPLADQTSAPEADPEPEVGDTTARVYLLTNQERLAPRDRALEGDQSVGSIPLPEAEHPRAAIGGSGDLDLPGREILERPPELSEESENSVA